MRERGWREAGVTDAQAWGFGQGVGAGGGVGAWARMPMDVPGLDGLGGVSGRMNGV